MKRIILPLLTFPLFAIVAASDTVAAADPIVSLSTDFPGGNLRVISNDGATVKVAPDLRGGRDWFYWCFEATASKPGVVTFRFPEKVAGFRRGAVGFQGPAVSNDGGKTWSWRGSNDDFSSADEFSWDFTAAGQTMRFAVTIPYTRSDFARFVEQHRDNPHLLVRALTKAPYPPSPVIGGISLDWSTHRRAAQGSDNFQLTWADDDHQYGWWGDGGGFGGTNSVGRVGLGFARVEGSDDDWKGFNVWGGRNAEHKARFNGKSWGTICVDGTLYSWVVPDVPDSGGKRDHYRYIQLARSNDHGASWTRAGWRWRLQDDVVVPTFLNFGRDNADARDEFVYSYFVRPQAKRITQGTFGLEVHKPGGVFLARVRSKRIFAGREHYEWFAGMNGREPRWGPHAQKQAVFEDPNGTGWCLSAVYDPGLKRYLLCTEHGNSHSSLLGLFDAPNPWGPWTTVEYWTPGDHFGQNRPGSDLDWRPNVFFLAFPPKWFTADGIGFTINFTGGGSGKDNDSFNTVQGRFHVNPQEE